MGANKRRAVDIYLLGRGIVDGVGQMTLETMQAIKASRLVYDLSGDAKAVRKLHRNVVDLHKDYWTGELCLDVYDRLENLILEELAAHGPTISVVVDGHPMFFDDVNWSLLRGGKRHRRKVVALPGISCLDTMMIDVGADLGEGGQIVHANQLLLYDITLDPFLQTYVLQVGKFGTEFFSRETRRNLPGRFEPLVQHLTRFYSPDHVVTLIVSQGASSNRKRMRLGDLDDARAFLHRHEDRGLTLHIPSQAREISNHSFSKAIDEIEHLSTIAELT